MSVKYKELEISDRIMSVVDRGLTGVEKTGVTEDNVTLLEKLTKIYTMLMSSTRENIKHKVFSQMSDIHDLDGLAEDLQDSGDDSNEDAEATDDITDPFKNPDGD